MPITKMMIELDDWYYKDLEVCGLSADHTTNDSVEWYAWEYSNTTLRTEMDYCDLPAPFISAAYYDEALRMTGMMADD